MTAAPTAVSDVAVSTSAGTNQDGGPWLAGWEELAGEAFDGTVSPRPVDGANREVQAVG